MSMHARLRPTDPAPRPGRPDHAGDADGMPAIDLVHLSRQTLGDRELETELLTLFAQQAAAILDALRGARQGSDMGSQKPADLLHMLCGSARAVGCWDVAAQAQDFEQDLRHGTHEGRTASFDHGLHALAARIARASAAIADLLGERA